MMQGVRAWAVVGLGVSMTAGCAGEQEPLIVLHSVAPMVDEEGCVYDAGSDAVRINGTLDVSAGTGYFLAPVLQNNLVPRSTKGSNTGVEDGELQLASPVDVTLHLPGDVVDRMGPGRNGERLPLSFPVAIATDSLEPGQLYAAGFEAVPAEYAVALQPAIDPGDKVPLTVGIVFHATRTGNSRGSVGVIDARLYEFPITLNNGEFVVGCECDDNGECIPGTGAPLLSCGSAQDILVVSDPCAAPSEGSSSGGDSSTTIPP